MFVPMLHPRRADVVAHRARATVLIVAAAGQRPPAAAGV